METIQLFEYQMKVIKKENLVLEGDKIKSSYTAYECLNKYFNKENEFLIREYFYVLYLNNSNKIIGTSIISCGGMTGTVVDVRLLFREAILVGATAIIIAHNHPSGKLQPSQADISITRKIKDASKFLDIELLDHLILTEESYYSFVDEGIL